MKFIPFCIVTLFFVVQSVVGESFFLCAQDLPVSADYSSAIKLTFDKRKCTYGPTVAPKGFGKVNEIKACDKQDIYSFDKEHNTSWYTFIAPEDGDLIIEITPENPKNDYDFMLYKSKDTSFYTELMYKNILPVRVNLARSGKEGASMTGLSFFAKKKFVPSGPGESFSKPLTTKKGEKYILIIDNVYPKGKGHTINMYYLRDVNISGNVQNELKKNVSASVYIEDKDGNIIAETQTDTAGRYSLNAKILDSDSYTLIYYNDSSFANCMEITSPFLAKTNYELKDIKTTLLKLSKGKKYILGAVDFKKGTCELLPTSSPSLRAICRLMKNPKMTIQIEGHVNNGDGNPGNMGEDHRRGKERAKAVYEYLLSKGIDKERMSYTSYGSLYMIIAKANSQKEIDINNRVEIFVTSK